MMPLLRASLNHYKQILKTAKFYTFVKKKYYTEVNSFQEQHVENVYNSLSMKTKRGKHYANT